MYSNLEKLIDKKISDTSEEFEKDDKKIVLSKMDNEEFAKIRETKNIEKGKAKKSGLKWSLEDRIKLKSLYKKDTNIAIIATKLERTSTAILAELLKSEVITKEEKNILSTLVKNNQKASKTILS